MQGQGIAGSLKAHRIAVRLMLILPLLSIEASAQGYGNATQTIVMNNETGRYIQYEFTLDNNSHVWPGGNKAFDLPPHERNDTSINCFQGQKICYGAWVKGDPDQYWGVGDNQSHGCDDCCFRCKGDSVRYNLQEGDP